MKAKARPPSPSRRVCISLPAEDVAFLDCLSKNRSNAVQRCISNMRFMQSLSPKWVATADLTPAETDYKWKIRNFLAELPHGIEIVECPVTNPPAAAPQSTQTRRKP